MDQNTPELIRQMRKDQNTPDFIFFLFPLVSLQIHLQLPFVLLPATQLYHSFWKYSQIYSSGTKRVDVVVIYWKRILLKVYSDKKSTNAQDEYYS